MSTSYLPLKEEVLLFEHAFAHQLPLLIKGPTGVGKTRFVTYMAQRLNVPLYTVACHDDLTATDLIGRFLIRDNDTVWIDGPLTRAVREGGICYLDEVVEARKDVTVVLHPLADHRRELFLERTCERLVAPPSFMLVVSYNPGYQNFLKGLKPSTRQRFVALRFDFPTPTLEEEILKQETGCPPWVASKLVQLAQAIRQLKQIDLEEVISARSLVYAAKLINSGVAPILACRAAVVEALTDDDAVAEGFEEIVRSIFEG